MMSGNPTQVSSTAWVSVCTEETSAFQVKAQQNIGHTSVQLVLDSTNQNVVFAMCESSTFIFQRLLNGTGTNMYRLCQVFLSDHLAEREGMAFQVRARAG